MVLIGPDGCIVRANREQSRMCGFDSPDELIGVHATRLVAPSCRDRSAEVLRRRLGGEDIPPVAYELLRNDGSTFLGETSATILRRPDGTVSGYVCSTVDTTESVRAEEQLRALSGHLVALREEDHTRMAREIHDELGQGLSALRLDLSWLARKLPAGTDVLRRRAEASIALIDDLIAVGQRIVADLRPPILDDLGLVPAMEWFVQRFTEHSGIPTTLESGSMPAPLLSGPLAVVGYRIVQEALTNVARHAQARHATVRIAMDGGQLLLEVRDDGRGISQGGLDDPHAYGLVGMRERAASQGGTVRITGAPGRGTTVLVTLPLQPPAVEAR
jgi:PAS domain S-box-containing protein